MTSETLKQKHLLFLKEYPKEDIELILDTAFKFREVLDRPIKKVPSLQGVTIVNLFFENSTRTRLSFELAEKRLSADIVNFSASSSSLKKGETLIDTVNNILAMKVDMVVMRHPNPGAAKFLSEQVDSRIVNAGDGSHEHPTQALLDAYSIREELGEVKGKKVVIKKLKLKDPDTIDLENKISEKLGLTININHKGKKGGSIKIDYKTLDQLEMITQKLKN